ncbi:uncharacterized protein LOC135831473 [Planococcus citri]|uniref:uncharacterized protein LOC135831473 n=1 Tax=Planococcus citri TaxID=170843 RepID=UPI0031F89D41
MDLFTRNHPNQLAMLGYREKVDSINESNFYKMIPVKNETKHIKKNLSPKEFLEMYSLPRIVKITPEEPIATNESCDPSTLLNSTLLLYKQYQSGKIEAKKYPVEGSQKEISTVVIPDTYQGWFSVMTERGQVKARQYTTVQRLITAQVTAFLIIGPDVIGYYQNYRKTTDGAKSRYHYIKTTISSGQVLKLLAVYEDIAEQSTRSKRLSWPLLGSKQQSTQYAQCMTIRKQIVYIPMTTHGYFYAVSTANNTAEDNVSKVYQISKLLQVFPLPVRVCSIYPQKINGSILLESYHKEDVMLACVLDDKHNIGSNKFRFLEIDTNSKFFVNRVPDEHRLFKKTRVQKALRNCHTDSEKWCQQLKIIHHIYPSKKQPVDSSSNSKLKRTRRISLGDKKTVKSASFRYSTSYGEDNTNKIMQRAPSNMYKPVSHTQAPAPPPPPPPVYLNIACKPNEENCSSLPIQKSHRTILENEVLQCILQNQRQNEQKHTDRWEKSYHDRDRLKKSASDSSYLRFNDQLVRVTNNDRKIQVTKNNYNGVSECINIPKYQDPKYKVVKKENNFYEQKVSPDQPIYKTQVTVKINDSYSVAADALRSKNGNSTDNIYAEIDEYPHLINNYPIYSKNVCYINDNCSNSFIIVPSTSTVNVS